MASLRYTLEIPLNGTGTEIPILNVTDTYDLYLIKGSAIAIGNYALVPTGTPVVGLTYKFQYTGNLNITTNTKTFSLFGYNLTQTQLSKGWEADCYYNGTSWEVTLKLDFSESAIIENFQLGNQIIQSNNLATNAINTSNITNGSITLNKLATDSVDSSKIVDGTIQTIDLGNDCITTAKILDLNITTNKINDLSVTTNKLDNQAVTTAKIANSAITNTQLANLSVNTQNIVNNSITNTKLATGTPSSIKIHNNLGAVTELALGADELPIGDGTNITTINKSSFNYKYIVPALISLEATNQPYSYRFSTTDPGSIKVSKIDFTVISTLAGTDDATITIATNYGTNIIGTKNLVAGLTYSSYGIITVLYSMPITGIIEISATKATPGGLVMVYIHFEKI